MRVPSVLVAVVLFGCGSDATSTESACDRISLQRDNTELWFDGGLIIASGVLSATVTTQSGGGPTTTIVASVTRQSTGFAHVISSYTVTINGETCRWP